MDKKSSQNLNEKTGLDQPVVEDKSLDQTDDNEQGALLQKQENVVAEKKPDELVQASLGLAFKPSLKFIGDESAQKTVADLIEKYKGGLTHLANLGQKRFQSEFLLFIKTSSDPDVALSVLTELNALSPSNLTKIPDPTDLVKNKLFIDTWTSLPNQDQGKLKDKFGSIRVSVMTMQPADWESGLEVLAALANAGQGVETNLGTMLPRWVKMYNTYGAGSGAPKNVPFEQGNNLKTHVEKHLLHQHGNPDLAEPPQWMQLLPFDVLKSTIEGLASEAKLTSEDIDKIFPNSATKLDAGNKAATDFFFGDVMQRTDSKPIITALRDLHTAAYEAKASAILGSATKPFVIDGGGKVQIVGPKTPFITFARIQDDLSLTIMSAYIPTDLNATVGNEAGKKVWDL